MGTHMEVERRPAGERLVTACIVTLVRPFPRMCPSMAGEAAGVTEPLPTPRIFTTMWSLPGVDADVHMEGRALKVIETEHGFSSLKGHPYLDEGFIAAMMRARKRSFTGMYACVSRQIAPPCEGLVTQIASV